MNIEERAREYLNTQSRLGQGIEPFLVEFSKSENALTLRRIADELFDFVRTDKRRVMSLEILRERLAVYIEKLRQEAEEGK